MQTPTPTHPIPLRRFNHGSYAIRGSALRPPFADPLEWDKTKAYEPLTIVYHNGNSYTSRQYVPVGIEITNTLLALTATTTLKSSSTAPRCSGMTHALPRTIPLSKRRLSARPQPKPPKRQRATRADTTAYGVGNGTNYGHVRLAVASTPATSDATAGIAATPKVVNDAVAAASNTLQASIDTIEGDVAELKAQADKGETIKSLYVIGDSYLEGYNPDGNVIGFGNVIKTTLKVPTYHEDALGGAKWDASTATRITGNVLNYDVLLIALGHNNMTSNTVAVSQYVAATLNKLQTLGYKGKVFLCSTLATAKYTCQRMLEVDNNIVLGMQAASYSFPCAFIANGWSWLIDSADYGTSDKGQHPKQAGQNLIAANIISGMRGGNTLNAAHAYGSSGGVSVSRVMMNVIVQVLGAKGNDGTVVYKPRSRSTWWIRISSSCRVMTAVLRT